VEAVYTDCIGMAPQPRTSIGRHLRRFALLAVLFVCPLALAARDGFTGRDAKPQPLTRIQQLRELSRQQAAQGPEVCFHAVVTFFDPGNSPDLFIQDETAGT
jgi:hypothetical protein